MPHLIWRETDLNSAVILLSTRSIYNAIYLFWMRLQLDYVDKCVLIFRSEIGIEDRFVVWKSVLGRFRVLPLCLCKPIIMTEKWRGVLDWIIKIVEIYNTLHECLKITSDCIRSNEIHCNHGCIMSFYSGINSILVCVDLWYDI